MMNDLSFLGTIRTGEAQPDWTGSITPAYSCLRIYGCSSSLSFGTALNGAYLHALVPGIRLM